MNKITIEDLRNEPIFWSRLGFCYDPPVKNADGKPLVFTEDFTKTVGFHESFAKQGIRLHTSILHSGWVGVDEYDYSLTDRVLDAVMSADENIYYMPRVKLNVPIDWCYQNPEDTFCYYEGPKGDAEAIRSLVGTLKQDILGYEAPKGYYRAGDYVDTRPNVGGLISLQSISSEKWLRDASVALEKLIDHIENGKYADRIIGYHVCFGPCGEAMHWGRATRRYGDYGINQLRNFYDYGIQKYGDKNTLSQKWCCKELSKDNVPLPSPEERYKTKKDILHQFRADETDVICRDYDEFLSLNISSALKRFARVTKRSSGGKIVGCFYGYFAFIDDAAYAGHVDMDGILSCPDIDFLAAPMPYYRRSQKEPGGEMCFNQSVNLKKLWVDEIDCRTYLSDSERGWTCLDIRDVSYVLWREICKDVSHRSGFWWMDLGGGWYDSEEIMQKVREITEKSAFMRSLPRSSASDILVVADEKCYYDMRISYDMRRAFLEDMLCELRMSGALCDTYRLSDLCNIDLSQYKLIIFAFNYDSSRKELESIRIPVGATVMYCHAAGIRNGENVSLSNIKDLTGFDVEAYEDEKYDFALLREKKTKADIARRSNEKNTYILNCRPYISSAELRKIATEAGCKIYAPEGCAVYGDSSFIGIFACRDTSGEIDLPNGDYYDIANGNEEVPQRFSVSLSEDDVRVFVKR